jgi:hypothetical protein
LTPKRPRRQVENDEYSAFVRRILRAYARRVGDGDIEALALMLGLADEIDTAVVEAVKGVRAYGLLLGRNRRAARHHLPGGPATMGNVVTGRISRSAQAGHVPARMAVEVLCRAGMSKNLAHDARPLGRDLASIARVDKWPGAL